MSGGFRPLTQRAIDAIQRGWQRPRWINWLLYPVSVFYGGLMRVRGVAYGLGILRRHKLSVPVVVVGNLSVGGVGKTPLVIALVEALQRRGMKPGVISRGYRGRAGGVREVGGDIGGGEVDAVGDEPVVIHRRCRAPVVVGSNRVAAARMLLANHRCDILISDDGFQHLALRRDIDIVVVDGERRFGNGWCLPAGPLREFPAALARADIIVTNGGNDSNGQPKEFPMKTRIENAVSIDNADANPPTRALSEFAGATAHALAGIGNPGRFFRQLQACGIRVLPHPFPDHHRFTAADLRFAAADPHTPVLMTEKDAVKCAPLLTAGAGQFWSVPLQTTLAPGLLETVLARLETITPCPASTS